MEPSTTDDGGPKKRFGVFEFDTRARELTKHGVRLKLQEQPIQVLVVLLERAGQIVPREELQRRLWPDGTFVDYEQSLNKAVNKLREALGDSADHPIYIETLARRGYRFVAPVDGDRVVEAAAQATVPRRWRVPRWLGAAGLALAGVLGTGLWPIDAPSADAGVQLTNDATPKFPPLISDGNKVLYSDGVEIWAVSVSGGEPKRLSLPFLRRAQANGLAGYAPGLHKMLLASYGAGEFRVGELWLTGTEGEAPRKIGECVVPCTAAISPDAARIAVGTPSDVYLQSSLSGEQKRVYAMAGTQAPDLWWHPSGHRIGFLMPSSEVSKMRAWQVNDDGAYPRRIVPEVERGQVAGVWSRDGKRFFYGGVDGQVFVRIEAGLLGWLRRSVVTRLTASEQFQYYPAIDPSSPRRLYALGYTYPRGKTMRFDRKARRWVPFIDGFSGEMIDPSPDGKWLAYVAYPRAELRKCRTDGSDDVLLASGVVAINPSWSPDGRRIAFPGIRAGTFGGFSLWTVSSAGGDAAPYKPEINPGYDTWWSRDGKRILLGSADGPESRQSHITILHLDSGKLEVIPGTDGMFSSRWSPDEKQVLGLEATTFKLRIFDSGKGVWRPLREEPIGYPNWSRDGKYIYAMNAAEAFRIEVATGRREDIARTDFKTTGNIGYWMGWTKDWEPLALRDLSSTQIYRIDLDR